MNITQQEKIIKTEKTITNKKTWCTPDFELLDTDEVRNGIIRGQNEKYVSATSGFKGTHS